MIRKLLEKQLKYSIPIIAIFFLIIGFFGFFATQLTIDPSFSSLVSSDSQFNTYDRILANSQGSNDAFILFFKVDPNSQLVENRIDDLTDSRVQSRINDAKPILEESQYVESVRGPIFNEDNDFAQLIVLVDTPRREDGFSIVIEDLEYYVEQVGTIAGVESTFTGFPLLLNRVNTLLISDNLNTLAFTFIAVFLILLWYFRDLKVTLIALSIPTSSLIVLAGMMTLFGISITITLAAVGILVLGISVSFTIHVLMGFEKYLNKGFSHRQSIIEAMDNLHVAIIASFITTLAGFAALMFGVSPSSQSQGIVLSMAIIGIFFMTFGLLPCLLNMFASHYTPSQVKLFIKIKQLLSKLARFQTYHPKGVILAVVAVTIIMAVGASQVGFNTENDNWIPEDDPIQESFRENSYAFGDDFSSIEIVVESSRGDLRDVDVVRALQELESIIESNPNIREVTSPFSDIDLNSQSIIEALNSPQLQNEFNSDYTLTTIRVVAYDFGVSESGTSSVVEQIEEMTKRYEPYGTKLTLYGDAIRFSELGESLGRDTGITTAISFILVFIIATATYFSLKVGVMSILPIIISIIWGVGMMGFTGVPFTTLSTGLIALVLGIGIDFSIHLVNSTLNYLNRGEDLGEALENTLNYSGGALVLTTITTFVGFIALTLATLLGIQRLGLALAFSILSVFLVTIILVPAILSLSYGKKQKNLVNSNNY
ncbi:MAG: efflux RND transporter permease subunit [Candidatus Nanoarchaeia archaeon]